MSKLSDSRKELGRTVSGVVINQFELPNLNLSFTLHFLGLVGKELPLILTPKNANDMLMKSRVSPSQVLRCKFAECGEVPHTFLTFECHSEQCNGSTIKHSKNSSATSTNASSSKIKIPAAFDEEIAEYQRKPLTGNRIIDMEVLLNLFLQLCCPRCFEEGILLSEDSTYGLCSNFVIRCKHCDFYSGFSSSKKTLNCPEVNTRFVYGMRQIGKGFSAGFKSCGTLNLPRLSKTAYTNHENKLMSVISEVSELSMQKAASELF
ncbi:CCHC-type domain-containing protein [Trichonephila clavipes]|nr:CCHC-type domain-containing protein [Trichonephila clavipes]